MEIVQKHPTTFDLLQAAVYVVQATEFERICLWTLNRGKVAWGGMPRIAIFTVGEREGDAVKVEVAFVELDDQLVLFIEAVSPVTDRLMVDAWLRKNVPVAALPGMQRAVCDAANFHHCVAHIKALQGSVKIAA
jgi:hypothetical protein